ncbi:MAG: hypothetical protein IJ228_09545 [Succinivibrio sp.]|nr:hypothetical protein [Succinivibrio sp.]
MRNISYGEFVMQLASPGQLEFAIAGYSGHFHLERSTKKFSIRQSGIEDSYALFETFERLKDESDAEFVRRFMAAPLICGLSLNDLQKTITLHNHQGEGAILEPESGRS